MKTIKNGDGVEQKMECLTLLKVVNRKKYGGFVGHVTLQNVNFTLPFN